MQATPTTSTPTISLTEELIALADVPDALLRPSRGRKVGKDAVWRWTRYGMAGVAPLETIHIGRDTFTSRQALARFFDRVSAAKNGRKLGGDGATISQADPGPTASHLAAEAELARLGM